MSPTTMRRTGRSTLLPAVLAAMILGPQGAAHAAVPIHETGTTGEYDVTDTLSDPGATCRYEGAAGSWYLHDIRVPAPTIYGSSSQLRSVGYRLLLQRRSADGWTTIQRGPLISGVASEDEAADITGSSVVRDPARAPNQGRYRAALRLIWWDANARVEGTVILAIENHRWDHDDSVGATCRGRLPIS